ncbi:uncharacterized protein LOC100184102 [Ciona intestinalis]
MDEEASISSSPPRNRGGGNHNTDDDEFTNIQETPDDATEEWFEPPQNHNELNNLLQSLDDKPHTDDEFSFEKKKLPEFHTNIETLRDEMEKSGTSLKYMEDFEHVVEKDILMIGSVSIEDLEKHENKQKEEYLQIQQRQVALQQERTKELTKLAELAKERVWLQLKQQQKEASIREELLAKRERLFQEQAQKSFRQSENQLKHALEKRQAEVKAFYGDLTLADNQYGDSKGRRWRVEWSKTPQPVQIKLKTIRGIRDKVPKGRYVVMISLYDRLGGHVLRWSKRLGQQWGGATLPVYHDGHYSNTEIHLEQSVFTVLPPQWKVQPGMILAFELFLLRGSISPIDRVVAWGAFPICDSNFAIVQGHYKLPMLRGHMDYRITKHETIEKLIASDIDHWISNLYIQVVRLPRYLSGQKEYEVELQFTSGLLSHPDRIENSEEAVDGEKIPTIEDGEDNNSSIDDRSSNLSIKFGTSGKSGPSVDLTSSTSGVKSGMSSFINEGSNVLRKRKMSRTSVERHSPKVDLFEDLDSEDSEDTDELIPVKGQNGMFYKVHYKNPVEDYNAKVTTLLPQTPHLKKKPPPPKLTRMEELERHTFSVQPPFSSKGKLQRVAYDRAEYVSRMFISEMGFSLWRTKDFWITILLLVLLWFARLYIHYCGQWLFLQALRLPVNTFIFFPYTVNLNYQADLLTTAEEVGEVVLGPISNIIVQVLLVLFSWVSQKALGSFPLIFSKLILAFSLWVVLDPIMILIVDAALGRYINSASQPIGDAFKLYWHFLRVEGSGVIGIPMVIFLYAVVMFTAFVILYLYFLKLHNNGRILDVFHRLCGKEEAFFVPYDLELSNQELSFIVKKAEQWRGEDGERRKVTVYDYIWSEEIDPMKGEKVEEVTTHIAIHTLHLDGLREIYRHFLRLPDGAIVEVFGELGTTNLTPDVKTALLKRANSLENIFQTSREPSLASVRMTEQLVNRTNHLQVPSTYGFDDRPVTSDSMKTRETIHRDSDSSDDLPTTQIIFNDHQQQSSTA